MPPAVPAPSVRRRGVLAHQRRTWTLVTGAAVVAVALAGCGLAGAEPRPETRMDSTSLVALLPTAAADRLLHVGGVEPDELQANIDPPHLELARTIAERHGRTLADLQIAGVNGQHGQPTVGVIAIRIIGVPGQETAQVFLSNPDPSASPTPSPRPTTIAGHPVIVTEPAPGDRWTVLVRGEVVASISSPDAASTEAMVEALWAALGPAAAPSAGPG